MTREGYRYPVYEREAVKKPDAIKKKGQIHLGFDISFAILALNDSSHGYIEARGIDFFSTYHHSLDFYPGFGMNFRFTLDYFISHHFGFKFQSGFHYQRLVSENVQNIPAIKYCIFNYDKWSVMLAFSIGNLSGFELYAGINADFHLRSFVSFYASKDYDSGETLFPSKSPIFSLALGFLIQEKGFNIGIEIRIPIKTRMNDTVTYYKNQNRHDISSMSPEVGFYFKFGYRWRVK